MPYPLESSILRILKPNGETAGTGFLVAPNLAVTCAHVIEAAGGSQNQFTIRFHLNSETRLAILEQIDRETDLALLRLPGNPPSNTVPLVLGKSALAIEQPFRSFGYPTINTDGLYATGKIIGRVRVEGNELLQLESTQLATGFSGGPIVVNDQVVGVVTAVFHADETGKNIFTAWATPIEIAKNLSPDICNWYKSKIPIVETDANQMDRDQQINRLEIELERHKNALRKLKEQTSLFGISIPVQLLVQIESEKSEISTLGQKIQQIREHGE